MWCKLYLRWNKWHFRAKNTEVDLPFLLWVTFPFFEIFRATFGFFWRLFFVGDALTALTALVASVASQMFRLSARISIIHMGQNMKDIFLAIWFYRRRKRLFHGEYTWRMDTDELSGAQGHPQGDIIFLVSGYEVEWGGGPTRGKNPRIPKTQTNILFWVDTLLVVLAD